MSSDSPIYDFQVSTITGENLPLSRLRNQVMLIVNTASSCRFTPQLKGLQELHERYAKLGLVVLGFPCNQFANQDSGSHEEIANFCSVNYKVSFLMMGKIKVNGKEADPLYLWLCKQAPGFLGSQSIKWNFTKFLVGRNGEVLKRYAPQDAPVRLQKDIEAALSRS